MGKISLFGSLWPNAYSAPAHCELETRGSADCMGFHEEQNPMITWDTIVGHSLGSALAQFSNTAEVLPSSICMQIKTNCCIVEHVGSVKIHPMVLKRLPQCEWVRMCIAFILRTYVGLVYRISTTELQNHDINDMICLEELRAYFNEWHLMHFNNCSRILHMIRIHLAASCKRSSLIQRL